MQKKHIMKLFFVFILAGAISASAPADSCKGLERFVQAQRAAIDGDKYAPAETLALYNWKKNCPPEKKTEVRMVHDDNILYIKFTCMEPTMSNLVEKITNHDGNAWEDDCVEVYLRGEKQDADYYQVILTSAGLIYDAKNGQTSWNPTLVSQVKKYPDRWEGMLEIPFREIGIDSGKNIGFKINFGREEKQLGENSSWNSAPDGFPSPNSLAWASFLPEKEFVSQYQGGKLLKQGLFVIWSCPPYKRIYNDILPETTRDTDNIDVTVARNDKEAINLLVSNLSGDTMIFRVEPDLQLTGQEHNFQKMFKLREGIMSLDYFGSIYADALPTMNEANILSVPPGETRLIWVEVKTELPAGKYSWNLTLVPVNFRGESKKITIEANVLAYRFPDRLPVDVWTAGPYTKSWVTSKDKHEPLPHPVFLRKEMLKTAAEYNINWILSYEPPFAKALKKTGGKAYISHDKADYIQEEKLLKEYGLKWCYGYEGYKDFVRQLNTYGVNGTILDNPEIARLYGEFIATWTGFLEAEGVDFNDFYVRLTDEPPAALFDELACAAQVIKRASPKMRILWTIGSHSKLEDLKKLAPYADLWVVSEPRISTQPGAAEELAFYKQSNKPFWGYQCSYYGNMEKLLRYYRYRGIIAFMLGASGMHHWAFNYWVNNDWQSRVTGQSNNPTCCLFYHGDTGVVPTIRAEAYREAAEDLYILSEAKKLSAKTGDRELQDLIANKNLEALLESDKNPQGVLDWRTKLIRAIDRVTSQSN